MAVLGLRTRDLSDPEGKPKMTRRNHLNREAVLRRSSWRTARSMAIAMTGATLAAGLLVALPSASLATQRHPALRLAATSRVPESLTGAARADLIAAETRPRVRGISTTAAGFTSATLLNTRAHTGIIAGVVRSMAGMPFAGACITATGPSGSP